MDDRVSLERFKSILDHAAALSGDARVEYLARECGDDAELGARVEELLGSHDAASSFLRSESSTVEVTSTLPVGDTARRRIGPYTLLEQIGEGGFGLVYLADQHSPIQRKVALKLLRVGGAAGQVLARFEAERQAMALMDHPNIAVVHDAGVTETGDPYFVMEYVAGLPITKYADDQRLNLDDRLRLFVQLCEAVQHAHQKGVIHRDLKPSNVLVTRSGDRPLVKVIDFGVAKALGARLTDETLHTQQGVVVGTPEYMSPEQAGTFAVGVDTRSDVYSLGVILYELLVGTVPFDRKQTESEGVLGLLRLIRDERPPKPSTRLQSMGPASSQVAAARHTDLTSLGRRIRGDLEWITLKCLEKDPARRYTSAAALSEDLTRYLGNHPIMARPPSTAYHLRKLVTRHKAIAALGVLFAAFVLVFAVTVSVLFERQRVERLKAQRVVSFLQDMLASPDPALAQGSPVLVRDVLDRAAAKVPQELADEPEAQLATLQTLMGTYDGLGMYDQQLALAHSVVDLTARLHGPTTTERASALGGLGAAYRNAGYADSGISVLQESARIQRSRLGSDDVALATTLRVWADCLDDLGRYGEAEELYREALARFQKKGQQNAHDYGGTLNDFAINLEKRGQFTEAETTQRQALEIQRRLLGADHPDVLTDMTNLGLILRKQRKYVEAESVYRAVIEKERRVLGEDHPNLGHALSNLGLLLKSLGRFAEAETLYVESLNIARKTVGSEHPDIATSLNNLGALRKAEGKFVEAEQAFREALAIRMKVYGDDHPDVARVRANLGSLLATQSKFDEAESLERSAIATDVKHLGRSHPDVVRCRQDLVQILLARGKPGAARVVIDSCLAGQMDAKDKDPGSLARSRSLLGLCLLREGNAAAAEALLVENLDPILTDPTTGRQTRRTALQGAIDVLTALGKRTEAARYQVQLDSLKT